LHLDLRADNLLLSKKERVLVERYPQARRDDPDALTAVVAPVAGFSPGRACVRCLRGCRTCGPSRRRRARRRVSGRPAGPVSSKCSATLRPCSPECVEGAFSQLRV
jgi:hypothetical protein